MWATEPWPRRFSDEDVATIRAGEMSREQVEAALAGKRRVLLPESNMEAGERQAPQMRSSKSLPAIGHSEIRRFRGYVGVPLLVPRHRSGGGSLEAD